MSHLKFSKDSSRKPFNLLSRVAANIFVLLVDCYRFTFAGLLGGRCRFTPTCSCYAREAFLTFGVTGGMAKTVKRLCRCHPWGGNGYDPVVPPTVIKSSGTRSA